MRFDGMRTSSLRTARDDKRGGFPMLNARGPLLGVLFLGLLSELLWASAPLVYMVVLGVILVVFVLLVPDGLLGWMERRRTRAPLA